MDVVVRAAEPGDDGFIYSAWTKGAREVEPTRWVPREAFAGHVRKRLAKGTTLVACHPDDPAMAVGFLCFELLRDDIAIVHWVYVVSIFRRMGVARGLLAGVPYSTLVATSNSKHFARWIREKSGAVFDPYF